MRHDAALPHLAYGTQQETGDPLAGQRGSGDSLPARRLPADLAGAGSRGGWGHLEVELTADRLHDPAMFALLAERYAAIRDGSARELGVEMGLPEHVAGTGVLAHPAGHGATAGRRPAVPGSALETCCAVPGS